MYLLHTLNCLEIYILFFIIRIFNVFNSAIHNEKSNIPFSYMLYAYSVKRAYRGTKPKESFMHL